MNNLNGNLSSSPFPSTSIDEISSCPCPSLTPKIPKNPSSVRIQQKTTQKRIHHHNSLAQVATLNSFDLEEACERNEKRIKELEKIVKDLSDELMSPGT